MPLTGIDLAGSLIYLGKTNISQSIPARSTDQILELRALVRPAHPGQNAKAYESGIINCIYKKVQNKGTDWDQSDFGSPYYIDWSEEDNGTQTVGISFPFVAKFKIGPLDASAGVTLSISHTSGSTVALGNQPVFYCDPIMSLNDTGSLVFRCN